MELYILDKNTLDILYVCKPTNYEINLDEETNAKTLFTVVKHESLIAGNYIVVNGLYRQFLFIIAEDGISTEKGSNLMTVTALDISNLFNQKVIEKDTEIMNDNSIEEFIARTINENFVNSDDTLININYIDIYYNTETKGTVATNSENGLYNLHTFITNCRQNKNICTDFKFINGRLRIDITNKNESQRLIDTTLPEVVDYNKVYEADITAKVQVLIREDNSIYNLYLKADRTTTENKNDPERVKGRIEIISVDLAENARQEALNVFKGNSYKHLVEFKIAKTSQLMDVTQLYIGREIKIKTEEDIYDSYISAITIKDENFVYFKSGNLRVDLLGKLKKENEKVGNKLDITGGAIKGNLNILGNLKVDGNNLIVDNLQSTSTRSALSANQGRILNEKLLDYGWITVNPSNAFRLYGTNESEKIKCRKVGNVVEIRGIVTPMSNIASGGSATIFTLPEGYRPPHQTYVICQGSGVNKWLLDISPTGTVNFARYGASSNAACNTGSWLPFNTTFTV